MPAAWIISLHEAGHGVSAIVLGLRLNEMCLGPQARGGFGEFWPRPDTSTEAGAIVMLAGRAAVQHYNRTLTSDADSGAFSDVQHVMAGLTRRYGVDHVAYYFARADRAGRQLVAQNWPAIARVAHALVLKGRLSGDDARRIARL